MLAALPLETLPISDQFAGHPLRDSLAAVAPAVELARERLLEGARKLARSGGRVFYDASAIEASLAANLAGPLLQILGPVMVLELNVARLEGQLTGESPQERFYSFINRLRVRRFADALLAEYPVMKDQVAIVVDRWCAFSLEFLGHFREDWQMLRATFFPVDPGPLVNVEAGVGDTHRGGRSVLILTFESGARLVYKPRSLAVEEHFQQMLGWLNDRGAEPHFRSLKVLNRTDHGWSEFIVPEPCKNDEEVDRFYQRQGSYLALLYAMEAVDFHCDNLISRGEHPVLVDLEALFHPRPEMVVSWRADEIAGSALGYSVLRVGLLPIRMWANDESDGVDMSGLGSANGQLTPSAVPCWQALDTDEMHVTRQRVDMPGSKNRPTLDGREIDAFDHAEAIAGGFRATYRLLLFCREEMLGLLDQFSQDAMRVIVRPTQTYATLLRESFHPDVLRNEADRERIFDRLQDLAVDQPRLGKLVSAERRDLLSGDIPFFTTRPVSRHLWTSAGELLENYFEESGMDLVRRRLNLLNEQDLERQLWIVRASIATLRARMEGPESRPTSDVVMKAEDGQTFTRLELISEACRVADRLQELAFGGAGDAAWIGLVPAGERTWTLSPLGPDLYDGLPGVTLFLAHLGSVTGNHRYTGLAESALTTLRRQIADIPDAGAIGAFYGWGGILYALTHLGAIWGAPALFAEAERLLDRISESVEGDTAFDVIGGAAGCALALRSLHKCRPSVRILEVANACGEHLVRSAKSTVNGVGWLCGSRATAPLTGFAHGNAGIAYSLLTIFGMTGDSRFQSFALNALAYERSLFSAEHGNWPDLRNNASEAFSTSWCHGAPGIASSRVGSLRYVNDPQMYGEVQTALATTLRQGFGGNQSLCHGDLGNAEIMLQAATALHEPDWARLANRVMRPVVSRIRENGWICGNPLGVESPGLMTGLAGIGYALLRFADPTGIPSILALEPPVCRG